MKRLFFWLCLVCREWRLRWFSLWIRQSSRSSPACPAQAAPTPRRKRWSMASRWPSRRRAAKSAIYHHVRGLGRRLARARSMDPAVEAADAQKAVKDPDIMAYIGTYNSGAAKISMPILNHASLVMVSPANTTPASRNRHRRSQRAAGVPSSGKINYFRVVPADDIQGDVAAHFAQEIGREKCSSSTTASSTAKAWRMCLSAPAASSASRSLVTRGSTRGGELSLARHQDQKHRCGPRIFRRHDTNECRPNCEGSRCGRCESKADGARRLPRTGPH